MKHHNAQRSDRRCLSILTGYPRADRLRYVVRLLDQVDRRHQRGGCLSGVSQYDIHVYCDGDCGGTLQTMFQRVAFHQLTTYETTEGWKKPSTPDTTSNQSSGTLDGRRLIERLQKHAGGDGTILLSGVEFQRHRWLYVSVNYRRMLDNLFLQSYPPLHRPYESCVILEDDLVLAPDALFYLEAVERLMRRDQTVFTGSLFADNSYPLYAADPRRFRRVSHFAGLGFLLTRRRYVDHLRRTLRAGLQNWDEQVQKLVRRRGLVSVVPEVGRALHLRRMTTSNSRPEHPFESQLLNADILVEYDLDQLKQAAYDQMITDTIRRRPYIRYLTDALFFGGVNETVVYFGCKDDHDLHRILADRNLWGLGNGGVVRGSYCGSLFFRYYAAQVLIVCRTSHFYSDRRRSRRAFLPPPDTKNITLDERHPSPVHRRSAGLVHRLTRADLSIVVATHNQSCHHACADTDRKCDFPGLWLLNESCDVIGHVTGCRRCSTVLNYADGVLPGMDAMDGDRCFRAYPHFISCETTSDRYRRFCVCRP